MVAEQLVAVVRLVVVERLVAVEQLVVALQILVWRIQQDDEQPGFWTDL